MEENKTVLQEAPAMEATEIQPVLPECETPADNAKKSKNKKIRNIILIAIAATVLAAATIAFCMTRASYVAEQYVKYEVLWDNEGMDKYLPYYCENFVIGYTGVKNEERLLEKLSDLYDEDFETWEEYCEFTKQYKDDERQDIYGEYKLSCKTRNERVVSAKKAKTEIEDDDSKNLKALQYAGFDWDDVDEVKRIKVHVKIDGQDDNKYWDEIVYLIPRGISWGVITTVSDNS